MIESLSITVHAFVSRVSMSFSVNETLLPKNKFLNKLVVDCSPVGRIPGFNPRSSHTEDSKNST